MRRTPRVWNRSRRGARGAAKSLARRGPDKKRRASHAARTSHTVPRTAAQYFAMSAQSKETLTRVAHVVTQMRRHCDSLRQAALENRIDPRTVVRLARSALQKDARGRYKARASDHLLRVLRVLTPKGLQEVAIRDSRLASLVAQHANAVRMYLQTGNDSALRMLKRKSITDASGRRVRLLMGLGEIDILGSAGLLSFEYLYARSA